MKYDFFKIILLFASLLAACLSFWSYEDDK